MAKLLSGTRIYGTATVDTQLFVSGSNAASSTITGALQVVGGAGVGGNLYVGGTIYGTINGTITTATNADNVKTVSQPITGTYYPAFVNTNTATASYLAYYTTSTVSIDPSTGILTVAQHISNGGPSTLTYISPSGASSTATISNLFQNATPFSGTNGASSSIAYGLYNAPQMANSGVGGTSYVYQYALYNQPVIGTTNTSSYIINYGMYNVVMRSTTTDISSYTSNALYAYYAQVGQQTSTSSTAYTSVIAGYATNPIVNQGSAGSVYGVYVLGNMTGVAANLTAGISTTVTNRYAFYSSGGGSIGSASTVTVVNSYGMYLGAPTVSTYGSITNRWGIVQADALATNTFAGYTSVGYATTASQVGEKFAVNGGVYVSGNVTATTFVGNLTGAASQVQTVLQTANAAYYPTFVSANNASATAMSVYTTASFVINPSTGNIGIRSSSPSSSLYVAGPTDGAIFRVGNTNAVDSQYLSLWTNNAVSYLNSYNNQNGSLGSIVFQQTNNAVTNTIMTVGTTAQPYVGIGTSSPTTMLHVNDPLSSRFAIRIQSTASNTANAYTGIGFSGETANTKGGIFFQSIGSSYSRGNLVFSLNNALDQTDATTATSVMTLRPTGAVAFGTSGTAYGTSGQFLQSNGDAAPTWVATSGLTAGSATTATNVVIANETATSTVQYLTFISVSTGSSILKVAATTGLTYLPNSGYVGMGIATPTAPLHLVSSANSILKFQGGTTGSVGVLYSDATQLRFGDSSGSNGFTALTVSSEATIKTNATEAVRVDSSQQVGINTTRPNYRLDVRGQTYIGTAPTLPQLILGDTTNSTTSTITTNNGDLIFSANGTAEAVRITSSKGIAFGGSTNYGTSGQLLKSAGNASPTWVDQSTIAAGSVANSHTAGTGLTGSTYNGSAAVTWTLNTATLMTTAVTANNLAATATLGGSGYLYIGGYNTNPSSVIYPTPFTVNSTGPIAIADNFSGGGVEANIWNTVYPSSYASTGFRFQQLLTTNTYRDLVFFKNTGAIAFGGVTNYGTSGQLLQSNGDAAPTWVGLNAVTVGKATTATNLAGGTSGQIPYQTGPDTTSFMTNTNWSSSTNILSVTGTVQSTVFSRTGAINASSWTTTSPTFSSAANAFNDTSSAASATVSARVAISFLDPTFTANNAGVVITDAVNLYVKAPVAGTNVSFTNNWGIWNQGNSFVGGSEKVTTSLAVGSYSITANAGNIIASGSVGIGTATPGYKLTVAGANTSGTPLVQFNATGSGSFQRGVQLFNTSMAAGDSIMYSVGTADSSRQMGQMYYYYAGSNSTSNRLSFGLHSVDDVLNITGAGNVGISTTSPTGRLTVVSTSGTGGANSAWSSAYSVFGPNAASTTGAALGLGYNTTSDASEIISLAPAVAWKPLNLFSAGLGVYSSSGVLALTVTSAGGVAFGTSATAYGTSGQLLKSLGNASPTWVDQSSIVAGSVSYSLTAGTGLSGSTYNGSAAVTWTNSGVTSNVAGTGISVSGATGAVTITNSGVTSIVAGTNISVSGATGAVTVNVSGTVGAATAATYARALQQTDGTSFLVPVDPRGASGSRSTDLAPNTYSQGLFSEFKNSSLYTGVSGNYAGLITYANWVGTAASTGDPNYSLLFSPQAANSTLPPRLQLRAGIDTTWGKWSDILHSGNYASAAGAWTPNFSGGVRGYANGSFKKDSGNNGTWDAQVYSSEGYSSRVYCSFKAGETTTHIMAGLNSDPTTDAVYASIDYSWYLNAGTIAIYESGASIYASGTYSVNDVFTITYDGTNVRYYYNDTLIRTIARSVSGTLYFDSSFYETSSSLTSVAFGSTGVGGATGASLTLASLGVGTPTSGTAGAVTAPILQLGRSNFAGSGISWYSSSYTAWSTYMATASATSVGPTSNITAPTGTLVTSWALRNFVENASGYGWTWESGTSTGNPTVVAEIRSSDGSAKFNGTLSVGASFTAGTNVSAGFYQDATNGAYRSIVASGVANGFYFQNNAGASTAMYVGLDGTYKGLIGIGNTSPAQALHVTGQIIATSEITAYYSDRRLKENVKPIDNAVEKVLKLNGITYNPNELAESFGFERDLDVVGLFADEVESVLPQAVKPAPFDQTAEGVSKSGENYKTVQYEKLVPLLVEAIKEQQKQIAQLSELVNKLTNK